jgi:hypothetical protein
MIRACVLLSMLVVLAGCASTSTSVQAGGSNRGAGASATVGTGIKF